MVKVLVPILIQNPYLPNRQASQLVEGTYLERESFSDGPVSSWVCIIDDVYNAEKRMAVYKSPDEVSALIAKKKGKGRRLKRTVGRFYNSDASVNLLEDVRNCRKDGDLQRELEIIESPEFMQVNAFAVAEKVVDLIEDQCLLGRSLQWFYSESPLQINVRSAQTSSNMDGKLNASYRRDKVKKRTFVGLEFVKHPEKNQMIHACLSREIVAHEVGHAVIDAINPSLYELAGTDMYCRAVHEGVADLTALLISFSSGTLTKESLWEAHGKLDKASEITNWGEIFAYTGQNNSRSFLNKHHLLPGRSKEKDYMGQFDLAGVTRDAYNHASVLTGAIFGAVISLFELRKFALATEIGSKKDDGKEKGKAKDDPEYSASGGALESVLRRIQQLIYRALDYLPDAEISLADYCRAFLLADHIIFGAKSITNGIFRKEFLKRGLFQSQHEAILEWPNPPALQHSILKIASDRDALLNFIDANRAWFGLPMGIEMGCVNVKWIAPINVPDLSKGFFDMPAVNSSPQGILKITWEQGNGDRVADSIFGASVIFNLDANVIIGRLLRVLPVKSLFPSERVYSAYVSEHTRLSEKIGNLISTLVEENLEALNSLESKTVGERQRDIMIHNGRISVRTTGLECVHN